jgi:hypothetical protein
LASGETSAEFSISVFVELPVLPRRHFLPAEIVPQAAQQPAF